MSEFVFGTAAETQAVCRGMGWREAGRATWRKPDPIVYFICFLEQLEVITAGTTVHVVRRDKEARGS